MLGPRKSPRGKQSSQNLQVSSLNDGSDQNSANIMSTLESAKQEMQVLEALKQLSLDIFNMTSQIKQIKQKKTVLEQYQQQLETMSHEKDILGPKTIAILEQFIEIIKEQFKALNELDAIDKQYKRTMPWQKNQEEEDSKYSRKMSLSTLSKEAPSAFGGSSSNKTNNTNSTFFPQLLSPRGTSRKFNPEQSSGMIAPPLSPRTKPK